jgi:hypothetical protein
MIKNILILLAGILIGWLGSQMIRATNHLPQNTAVDSVTKQNSTRQLAEPDARVQGLRNRPDEATREQAAFDARLKAAVADPPMEVSSTPRKSPSDRASMWLAGISLPRQIKEAIRAQLEIHLTAGGENPITVGSPFDLWLRDRLDGDALASWTTEQNAHTADQIERRANQLLVGLQSSLPLTPEQKDSIYPQFVEWARENPQTLIGDDSEDSAEQERTMVARIEKLSAALPAAQREALAEWVAEFLPNYCLKELESSSEP